MKKGLQTFFVGLFLLSFASAQGVISSGLTGGMRNVVFTVENMFRPVFTALLGGDGGFLFEKVLFFLVVLSVVFMVTKQMDLFKSNKLIVWIITLSVSLLATRYLADISLIQAMLLPYSVFGVALNSVIPFVLYFTFVHSFSGDDKSTIRKILWIFFIVVFFGIWASRVDELGDYSWIYLLTALVAIICLFADGTIRKYYVKQKIKEWNASDKADYVAKLRKQLEELRDDEKHYHDKDRWKRMVKHKEKEIQEALKS